MKPARGNLCISSASRTTSTWSRARRGFDNFSIAGFLNSPNTFSDFQYSDLTQKPSPLARIINPHRMCCWEPPCEGRNMARFANLSCYSQAPMHHIDAISMSRKSCGTASRCLISWQWSSSASSMMTSNGDGSTPMAVRPGGRARQRSSLYWQGEYRRQGPIHACEDKPHNGITRADRSVC